LLVSARLREEIGTGVESVCIPCSSPKTCPQVPISFLTGLLSPILKQPSIFPTKNNRLCTAIMQFFTPFDVL
jgi:hypothetical protein